MGTEEPLNSLHHEFTAETLITAYHSIVTSWHKEGLTAGKCILSLSPRSNQIQRLQLQSLLPLDIFRLPTYNTSGLRFFPRTTLQEWESHIKGLTKLDEIDDMDPEDHILSTDGFNLNLGDGTLHPTMNLVENIRNLVDWQSQVGDDPSGLATIISEYLPLNRKQ